MGNRLIRNRKINSIYLKRNPNTGGCLIPAIIIGTTIIILLP